MKTEQMLSLIDKYEEAMRRVGIRPEEVDKSITPPGMEKATKHAMWMLPKLREIIKEGNATKAERWFGWIQSTMWNAGFFSIDDMREHNRSPDAPPIPEQSDD